MRRRVSGPPDHAPGYPRERGEEKTRGEKQEEVSGGKWEKGSVQALLPHSLKHFS